MLSRLDEKSLLTLVRSRGHDLHQVDAASDYGVHGPVGPRVPAIRGPDGSFRIGLLHLLDPTQELLDVVSTAVYALGAHGDAEQSVSERSGIGLVDGCLFLFVCACIRPIYECRQSV